MINDLYFYMLLGNCVLFDKAKIYASSWLQLTRSYSRFSLPLVRLLTFYLSGFQARRLTLQGTPRSGREGTTEAVPTKGNTIRRRRRSNVTTRAIATAAASTFPLSLRQPAVPPHPERLRRPPSPSRWD